MCAIVNEVAAIPFRWPGEPTSDGARLGDAGTCASKHALLAERLTDLGISSRPLFVLGPLVPTLLEDHPRLADARDLLEVHELLTVDVPGVGPCQVDVTWDPPLVRAGLPGSERWDGVSDTPIAVGSVYATWAPDPANRRAAKEGLRQRLYAGNDRQRRDAALAVMSGVFNDWR